MSVTQPVISDEELMAFADGALDEPRFSEIAGAVEADAAIAARLEALVTGGRAAQALFAPLADSPVPARLRANVEAAIAGRPANVVPLRRRPAPWVPAAMAAGIAVLVATPLGVLLGRSSVSEPLLVAGAPLGAVLAAELGSLPSGAAAALPGGATLRPIATFTDAAGATCREFELDGALTTVAVACRAASAWRVAIAIDAPAADSGYAPASSLAALDAFLASIEAGPPLDPAAEAALLAAR